MASLEQIKEQKATPWPTAPVGLAVNWFDRNDSDRCYAALVTKIEGPAKIAVVIFRPNAHPVHKLGVLHRSHPICKNRHATEVERNGTWDYVRGQTPLKCHYETHLKELERREQGILEQQRLTEEAKTVPRAV